jgi:hypothetical protein
MASGNDSDSVLEAFLAFLDSQINAEPHLVRPLTAADLNDVDELLDGVIPNPDEPLPGDFQLP